MEKDQALLKKLLTKADLASRTEVDMDTHTVRVLDRQKVLEVLDEVYGSTETPSIPHPAVWRTTLGEKKRRYHHSKKTQGAESQVTYTGEDISGNPAPKPKKHKAAPGGSVSTPSLSILAPAVPKISKTPIRQVLDEYGCTDEKFVRAMISDLKGIDLDRVRFKEGSPSESRKIAREHLMKVSVRDAFVFLELFLGTCLF